MLKLYKFNWDCGRNGALDGIFTAESDEIEKLIGKMIYFGEVLGKHSEVYGTLDAEDLTVMSDDPVFISKFIEIMGTGTVSGFNPLDYYDPEDEDED
jgi:hypothetical protein